MSTNVQPPDDEGGDVTLIDQFMLPTAPHRRSRKVYGPRAVKPGFYTDDIADELCERIMLGETIRELDLDPTMPSATTILTWLDRRPAFREKWNVAVQNSALMMEHDMLHIAAAAKSKDEVLAAKLRISTMQWVASKRAPQVYGDKLDLNVSQQPKTATLPIAWDKLSADEISHMRALMAKALTTTQADREREMLPPRVVEPVQAISGFNVPVDSGER